MLRVFPPSLVGTVGGRSLRITELCKSNLHWSNSMLGEGPQWALNLPFVFNIPVKLSREWEVRERKDLVTARCNVFSRRWCCQSWNILRCPYDCQQCWGFRLYESFIVQTSKVGFFSLSSTILSFLTLKCNSLLLLIEQCSYLHVSLWHNQWNNLNISYTDFTFFREAIEPFVLWFYIWGILFSGIVLPHRVDGNCCCQRQPYSSSWFFESISALFQLFF